MKISFSLGTSKPAPVGAASSGKHLDALSLDDDEPMDAAPTMSDSRKPSLAANTHLVAMNMSKTTKRRMEEEQKVDETVYQYDEVWDKMQEMKMRRREAKETDVLQRKPKYIEGLLTSAATRRLDHLRAEEKMMQREREREGDEFKDKESFVTQAYKDQMEEVRKAEEEEKKREELAKKKNRGINTGMTHFYRQLLEESAQQHDETVAATEKKPIQGPSLNLTITKPPDRPPMSDLELAQRAMEEGKDVVLNDDNEIVDKRDLLAPGLNLSGANTRRLHLLKASKASAAPATVQTHRAVGTAASRREINERRAREIREQMDEERWRLASEAERAEREATAKAVARRNTQEEIQSARDRYLERKRRRLEEQTTALDDDV